MRLAALLSSFIVVGSLATPALAQEAENAVRIGDDPLELGVFLGGMWLEGREARPSLQARADAPEYEAAGAEAGVRGGFFPIDYLGLEAEAAGLWSKASDDSNQLIGIARGHLVLQLPLGVVAPFLVGGAGVIGSDCPAEGCASRIRGRGRELGVHFGAGAKVGLAHHFHLRLDLRDTIAEGDHLPEALLTAGFSFGRSGPPEREKFVGVEADSDGDGLIDKKDRCPREPAPTPDGCPIPVGDRDGDGKKDDVDKCPDEPSELPDGCPDLDPDKDGIKGTADKCPEEPGIAPDGCPDPDPDKDGIEGKTDKCPNTPETVNGFEDRDGCPDTLPEQIKKFTGVVHGIEFDTGKATIRPMSYGVLDQAVSVLKEYPDVEIRISGHTDSQGSAERNRELSLARAEAVASYFRSRGIEPDRLTTVGHGPDKPIADNSSRDGRQRNRRIEFEIIQ